MVTLPIYHSNAGVIGVGSALIRYQYVLGEKYFQNLHL